MKLLYRYLAGRLLATFALTLAALCMFFVIVDVLTHRLRDIVGNAMPWRDVVAYYAVLMPEVIAKYHLAGLAVLIAVLVVMGSCARRNELTAMLTAGVPLRRQAMPALGLAFVVMAGLLAVGQWVRPGTDRQARLYEAEYLSNTAVDYWGTREPVSWSNLEGGWSCHITKFNRAALSGEEVFMLALRGEEEEQIRVRRIYWDEGRGAWILEDGLHARFTPQPGIAGNSNKIEHRITQEPAPIVEDPQDLLLPYDDPASFATFALPGIIRSAQTRHVPAGALKVEFASRFSAASLPLILVIVGTPLAARIQKGGRSAAVALAIALAVAYLVVFSASKNLGSIGRVDPTVAAWLANVVFLAFGLQLLRRAPT
jgi:lipopolysaccharide export system permease protein